LIRTLSLALAGAPLVRLGRALGVEERRRRLRPRDLPPIPWIGHC
jgi:hypothetical protein